MSNSPIIKILLIEDNQGDVRLLKELAEAAELAFEIVHCETIAAASHVLGNGGADVVLLDLGLPDAMGLDAVRRVHNAAPALPLVVLTGLDDETLAVESLKEGAQDYLVKGSIGSNSLRRALRYAMERQRVQLEFINLSLTDDLTGLYNRRGFMALAEHRVKLAVRMGEPFLIAFLDLDGLKQVNDTFGHQEGNRALVDSANVLRDSFRQSDIIARIGGDEFAVFIAGAAESSIPTVKRRMQQKLDACNAEPSRPCALAFSIGIVSSNSVEHSNIDAMVGLADALMYRDKNDKRRSRVVAAASGA